MSDDCVDSRAAVIFHFSFIIYQFTFEGRSNELLSATLTEFEWQMKTEKWKMENEFRASFCDLSSIAFDWRLQPLLIHSHVNDLCFRHAYLLFRYTNSLCFDNHANRD